MTRSAAPAIILGRFIKMENKEKKPFAGEALYLTLRNLFALAATLLFAITLLGGPHKLRAFAYFCGAAAYLMELAMMTDGFKKRPALSELFMAMCFCPLYVLLGIDYLG